MPHQGPVLLSFHRGGENGKIDGMGKTAMLTLFASAMLAAHFAAVAEAGQLRCLPEIEVVNADAPKRACSVCAVALSDHTLRNAAGDMIDNVTKAIRRNQTVDDAFIDKLFDDMTSLYRLDQLQTDASSGRKEFGALPGTAVWLIALLIAAWAAIGTVFLVRILKRKKKKE